MRDRCETRWWILGLMVFLLLPGTVDGQETRQSGQYLERIEQLESEIERLHSEMRTVRRRFSNYADASGLAFLAGAFCALWAKNSGRRAWLWFFMGAIFAPITILVLLYKNAHDVDQTGPA